MFLFPVAAFASMRILPNPRLKAREGWARSPTVEIA
jgi:hypothetical protein